jgi:quinoprotein glucose dehydrogenase
MRNPAPALAGVIFTLSVAIAQQPHTAWSDYLGGSDSSHYSALKQINRSNVDQLEVAWTYATGDENAYVFSPIAVGNMLYVLAKSGSLVAIDAATATEIWTHRFSNPSGASAARSGVGGRGRANRGINYWESSDKSERRLLIAANDFLEAIDARTGSLIDSFGDHGQVDLRVGLGRDPKSIRRIQSNTPGRVFENLIILGSSTGEEYLSPPGDLRAYDVHTGQIAWTFHTIPHPGELGYDTWPKDAWKYIGGTNTWGEITVDEKRGIAYFPLGSPTYDFYGGDRKGANLFSDCLLALDARTGKYLWHYQLIHHDLWDYDAVPAPQLVTIRHNAKTVDAVAEASKQGFLYVFDRVTGKPLWPILEKPVPQTNVPGESTWPTQPFPTSPPPFARQKFTPDDLDSFFLTPEDRAKWKDRLLSARNEGLFTPPALDKETVYMPGHNGGSNFFGSAADPTNGAVYVVAKNVPVLMKLRTKPTGGGAAPANAMPAQYGRAVYQRNCQSCHGAELEGGLGPALGGVVSRRGHDDTLAFINQGQGEMPAFSSLPDAALNAVITFLSDPSAAPAASQPNIQAPVAELPYPADIEPVPNRLYAGGGLAPTVISPPWSTLTAYDLNSGAIKWQVPYGDAPQAGPSDQERGNLFQRSGIALTAGGLIFFASNEGKLRILDKDTGKELRVIDLPRGSQGIPAVFEAGGREYVVINATGAFAGFGSDGPPARNVETQPQGAPAYVAFALPKPRKSK